MDVKRVGNKSGHEMKFHALIYCDQNYKRSFLKNLQSDCLILFCFIFLKQL